MDEIINTNSRVTQLARVPSLQVGSREFESLRDYQVLARSSAVERRSLKADVVGSNPTGPAK